MAPTVAIGIFAVFAYWVYSYTSGLSKNIATAKRIGLPYMITRQCILFAPEKLSLRPSAVNPHATYWLVGSDLLGPILKLLPDSWTAEWLP
jgi:hypothetical protein